LKDAGEWKTTLNFIGNRMTREVIYVPARPERVVPELQTALDWLHDATSVPPLVRAILFHHEFESIHPFRDGNGRTGRALTPMALHEFGYPGCALAPIDFIIHRRRGEYYQNLALVERNGFTDYTPWLAFMTSVVRTAYEEALGQMLFQKGLPATLSARQRLVAEWFGALNQEKPELRVKFNDVHHAFPQIAERTLKRDLTALRDAGVLEVEGVLKGTRYQLAAVNAFSPGQLGETATTAPGSREPRDAH
jgi:Fic family protein